MARKKNELTEEQETKLKTQSSKRKITTKNAKVSKEQSSRVTKSSSSLRAKTKQSPEDLVQTAHNESVSSFAAETRKTSPVRNDGKKDKTDKMSAVTVSVYDISGKEIEMLNLPKEIFGAKVNLSLMAQAVRVYLANQRQGNASTKTRGEVTGSTRKIYRQKGTGRARHGGIRAPIFVKGGIAHGPKPQDYSLVMPKKMKRKALFSALTAKASGKQVAVIAGLESIEPKTKVMAQILTHFGLADKKAKVLLVMPHPNDTVTRAGRNLAGVTITAADRLNTYEILNAKSLVFMKDAIEKMEEVFLKEFKSKNAKNKMIN